MATAYVMLLRRQQIRRERIFRDRNNPFDYMHDVDIVRRYRLSRPLIFDLCAILNNDLERPTQRSHSLPVSIQVLAALRFYASGSFQAVNGDLHGISKDSICRIVTKVSDSIARIAPNFIKMPRSDREIHEVIRGFLQIANFPNVIGAVDGTHIKIKAPSVDEQLFVNRKNFHSINVQAVCNSKLELINVVAKWPGSSHDSFVWSNSALCQLFENGEINEGWLLGDSAYPLRTFLMTPVPNPSTRKEESYNIAHARTRNPIERCFGVWKMRFRCLDSSGGTLLFSPVKCCKIAVSTAVLHNMCIKHNVPLPDDNEHVIQNQNVDVIYQGRQNDGMATRRRLIETRF